MVLVDDNGNQVLRKAAIVIDKNTYKIRVDNSDELELFFPLIGTPLFEEASKITTPGIEQALISITTTAITRIQKVMCTCRQPGVLNVYADGNLVGSKRLNAANINAEISWTPWREIVSGKDIEIKYKASSNRGASDVEAYFMGSVI